MMFNNKKAILPLLLSPVMIIIMGVLLLLILLAILGFAFFLTLNVFVVLGGLLVVVGAIGLLRGFATNVGFALIISGIVMILLPKLSENLAGVTLAVIMP